jgi:NCAIR mutase (PurE)-related protein
MLAVGITDGPATVRTQVYEVLRKQVPHTRYHPRARICTAGGTTRGLNEWGCNHEFLLPGSVVVLAAVTADLPVAEVCLPPL